MKLNKKEAELEFVDFLRKFDLGPISETPKLQSNIGKCFRYYYPLLLLEAHFPKKTPWKKKDKNEEFHLYFREAISDICQSIFLASSGFYKSSQLTLRSGLENWMRCLGLAEDQAVLALKSTYELLDLVGSVPAIKDNKIAKGYFNDLRSRYASLCGYVHTANASHMALVIAAGEYPRYVEKEADETFAAISEVCSKILYLFCIVAEKTYRGLHHRHFDLVSDALPKTLKKALNT
ncbi:hypothetical protein [Ciceribacter sp. T2.26MG-112.2]|uniref:hypothetical protein n=1 Tax=Ciceribacter sp. T2.26MG-112.2 TaxID=3137154 RepID=UPI0012B6A0A1|nr:hypothetical protein [Ciceribacter naphthalenivorans]